MREFGRRHSQYRLGFNQTEQKTYFYQFGAIKQSFFTTSTRKWWTRFACTVYATEFRLEIFWEREFTGENPAFLI